MKTTKHTPTPWTISGNETPVIAAMYDGRDAVVAVTCRDRIELEEAHFNAQHIVKCVNAHDELVAALHASLEQIEAHTEGMGDTSYEESAWHPLWTQIKTSLAKLEGGAK